VDELGHRAGPDGADVAHLVPDGVEHRLAPLEDGPVAAHPQRQPPRLGPARPPAHRRIQQVHAPALEDGVDAPDDGRRIGGQVDDGLTGLQPRQQASRGVEHHGLDLGRPRQRREDEVGGLRDGARRVGPAGSRRDVRRPGLRAEVVHDQRVPGPAEMGRHVAPHGAQPDEPDRHDPAPSKTRRAMRPALIAVGQPA
jgi:hypothetical protein